MEYGYSTFPPHVPLSQRRADAVATVLAEIRPDLVLTASGRGSRELIIQPGEGDQAVNRRVEVIYATS